MPSDLIPVYGVRLVHVDYVRFPDADTACGEDFARLLIRSPEQASAVLHEYLRGADREHFVALLLDTKGKLIGVTTISIGDLTSSLVHPREVFKPAILANSASLILGHNHPSGDPQPSPEDIAVTRRLCESGDLLGIAVLDHIIIGNGGRGPGTVGGIAFVSLKEKGFL